MEWVNAVVQGILLGGFYALFATGLSLAFGVMRFVNLAHGDLAIMAAFLAVSLNDAFGMNPFVALAVVVPVFVVLGYVLQRGLFNFTLGSDPLPSILVSFGLGIVLQQALLEHYTANARGLDGGSIQTDSIRITDDIAIGWLPLTILLVAIIVLGALQLFLSRTMQGRAVRAVSDDQDTAKLMGINTRNLFGGVMALAFATVALAGIFLGVRQTFGPSDGSLLLIFGFEAVVIGGLGSLWGTLLGGVVLGVSQNLGNQLDVQEGILSGVLVGHLVFLAVLVVRPTGLLGRGRAA